MLHFKGDNSICPNVKNTWAEVSADQLNKNGLETVILNTFTGILESFAAMWHKTSINQFW